MSKREAIALGCIVLVGFVIRIWFLPQFSLTFGYDQARDAYVARQIIHGDFKIQGPSANEPGLYHGVLYYYFLSFPYFVGNGNPLIAAIFLALFNCITIIVVYFFTKVITKNSTAALFSALLFAFSFEATQYATWLSNPSLAVLFVPLFYLFLWMWTQEKEEILFPSLAGLALAFSIQSEIFLAYHFIIFLVWIGIKRTIIHKKALLTFFMSLCAGLSTLILSEIKFGFSGVRGLFHLLFQSSSKEGFSPISVSRLYWNQLTKSFSDNIVPSYLQISIVLGIVIVLWLLISRTIGKQQKLFLLLYLFSHVIIVKFGGVSTPYIAVGLGAVICIITAIFLSRLHASFSVLAISVLAVLLWANIVTIIKENPHGQTIFAVVPAMNLKNELGVVDYTYETSKRAPFTINTFTNPLWMNITWAYLYEWHGNSKYGYLPLWHGQDQVGLIAQLPVASEPSPSYFTIVEPVPGLSPQFLRDFYDSENGYSTVTTESSFGGIQVQWRKRNQ